jgi:hypothetical protein
MTVEQILRGRKTEELSETEQEMVLRLGADLEELRLINSIKSRGGDVKKILRAHLKKA